MHKYNLLTLLFLLTCLIIPRNAIAGSTNWCGTYFEDHQHAFIAIPPEDVANGSKNCTHEKHNNNIRTARTNIVPITFQSKRKVEKWRKFNRHVIEIRGKMRNNAITNARFVRDYGA